MENLVDLAELKRILGRKGERVVVVVPGQEPIVLLSLTEYEQLSGGGGKAGARPQANGNSRAAAPRPASAADPAKLEAIDPPQGTVTDDDQYYPEPLE